MSTWQILAVLAIQALGWYGASHITETRAARRDARRAVLDQQLNEALRDLRIQHAKEQ